MRVWGKHKIKDIILMFSASLLLSDISGRIQTGDNVELGGLCKNPPSVFFAKPLVGASFILH